MNTETGKHSGAAIASSGSRLAGKVALVTGAAKTGNIGLAICDAFLREGAAGILATDVTSEEADALVEQMEAEHGPDRFAFQVLDVSSEVQWEKVVGVCVERFGQLDILVNNAGTSIHGGIEECSLENLRKVMAVNHDGCFLGMKACLEQLVTAKQRFPGGGSIINTVTMGSYMPNGNNIGYHVSKAAQRMLTMCAATEFGPKGVRVNSIHPGVTMTPLMRTGLADYVERGIWESIEAAEQALAAMNPLNAISQSTDITPAYIYLASDEAHFVTGAALCHDAGLGMHY